MTPLFDSLVGELLTEKKKKKLKHPDRDYRKEFLRDQKHRSKYRAELNAYNRKHKTYGNGDGKDASHKNGKIVGFEDQHTNRARGAKHRK